jgi:hypothetical protein
MRPLYVEVLVRAPMDRLWELTQDPVQHARWDLRFSRIVPVEDLAGGAVRFRYERSMGPRTITGTGTSVGERRRPDGTRTSALRFSSDDRLSPLRDGRGYWRYVPVEDGVRFVTGFDYTPGLGRASDLVLRPVVRWMTAWSFDRLRRWAETGEPPERWPLASVLALWRRDRPRAARCLTRRPAQGAMHDAPATLTTLEAP